MTLPTKAETQELFEYVCQKTDYYNIKNGLPEGSSRKHYLQVAKHAKLIAEKTKSLNPEKAYILGLLHDYGEYQEQKDRHLFHGTVGYDEMMYLGFDEVARTCISHSFFDEQIIPENYSSYDADCICRAAKIIAENPFDDYDRLIQISDLTAVAWHPTTIDERLDFVGQKYHIPAKFITHKKEQAYKLKCYIDKLCNKDVYCILGLNND